MLLLAALALLPWQSGGPAPGPGGGSGRTAIQAPGAPAGAAAAAVTAGTVAWLALATLATRSRLPHPGAALLGLGTVILVLVLGKLALAPRGLAAGAWASLGLAAGLVALQAWPGARRLSRPR